MIGLVIVGHGDYPQELIRAAESILAESTNMRAVCHQSGDDPSRLTEQIEDAARQVETGEGVIIMTDMMGGTPTNSALAMLNHQNIEVVTGVNLPMLLKVPFIKDMDVHKAAVYLVEYGRRNVLQQSEMLRSMDEGKPSHP